MTPEIRQLSERKLIGHQLIMSFAHNKTAELWKSFMPRRMEVAGTTSSLLFSVQIYGSNFFANFRPDANFKKWAAMEVTDFNSIPSGMEPLVIPAGLYAVFFYRGSSSNGRKVFQDIFEIWLPQSGFALDDRPHFEILGDKYKNGDPNSEEEIWIPVRVIDEG